MSDTDDVVNAICILQIVDGALKMVVNANPYLGSDKDWGDAQKLKIALVMTTPLVILVWKEEIVSGAETKPRVLVLIWKGDAQITVLTSTLALVALVPTIRTALLAKMLTTVNGAIISVLAKQKELFQMELLLAKFLLVFRAIPTARATEIRAVLIVRI